MSDTPSNMGSIPHAHIIAGAGGMVNRPEYEYPFDREADRQEFLRVSHERRPKRAPTSPRQRREVGNKVLLDDISVADAAADYGVSENTIRSWMRQAKEYVPPSLKAQRRTAAKMLEAKELREQGIPDRDIAKRLGVNPRTIINHLGASGAKCIKLAPEVRAAKKQQAKELHDKGLSFGAIGREVGVSGEAVARWFRTDESLREAA